MLIMAKENMNYNLKDINEKVNTNVKALVEQAELKYQQQIKDCVQLLLANKNNDYKFILLAGPSSAGKTTTSHLFKENLKLNGINAKVISIDNFFLEREETPKLPNGNYDFESLKALDWDLFGIKMNELIKDKKSILPVFDFVAGQKKYPDSYTTLNDNEVMIIEGLHALNPIINNYIPAKLAYKVYLNTESEFVNDDGTMINKENIKLIRRLIRDYKKRGSTPDNTINTYSDVTDGEKTYITPFKDTANFKINTTHAFEPGVYYSFLVDIQEKTHSNGLPKILETVEPFAKISYDLIPENSLTQEFLGGNDN